MKRTAIVVSGCAALVLGSLFCDVVRVDGNSMTPSLCDRDVVVVWSAGHRLLGANKGRIVIAEPKPGQRMLKRVVAAEGDRIRVEHGRAVVNGQAADEPYVCPAVADYFQTWPYVTRPGDPDTFTVPAGDVFLMGDNRSVSSDSRVSGSVSAGRIEGVVLARFSRNSGACACTAQATAQTQLAKH